VNSEALLFLEDMKAREAVKDVLLRYCHAIDRGDQAALEEIYWPDATDTRELQNGPADIFVRNALRRIAGEFQQTHTSVSNMLIRVSEPEAVAETYFTTYHRLAPRRAEFAAWSGRVGEGVSDYFVAGRYLDRLERRGSEWRIIARRVAIDWWRALEGSADWDKGLFGNAIEYLGKRHPNDVCASLFEGGRLTFRKK
jgi:hypothetical protein